MENIKKKGGTMPYQGKIKEVQEEIQNVRNYLSEWEERLLPPPGPQRPVMDICEPPYIKYIEICDAFLNWAKSRTEIPEPEKK
jgi:hypothetical protein